MAKSLLLPGDKPLINLGLVALTLLTTTFSFSLFFGDAGTAGLWQGMAFGVSAVAILGAHEMGHYLFARWHRVDTTLPYFIPLPFGFGTLGAVIRIKSRIPTRNALVDIGAAGPLAGMVVAIPLILYGLTLSNVGDSPVLPSRFPADWSVIGLLGHLWDYATARLAGTWTPPAAPVAAVTVFGDSLLMKGMTWLVFGPLAPGKEVMVHPIVIAGWFGLLVTMLNLCPIGQLDGGHLSFALWGERAVWVGRAMAGLLLFFALFYSVSWVLWFILTVKFIGFRHPEVLDPFEPLSTSRKIVCAVCFVSLILLLLPIPMQTLTL